MDTLKPVKSSERFAWQSGVTDVKWSDVITHDWFNEDNLRIVMKGGQTFSIKGALGVCNDVEPDENQVHHVTSRLCVNRSATSEKLSVDNIMRHHTGEVIKHQMHHGNIVFPIFPRDLETGLLDNCPSVVVYNHIRCWNSLNKNLPGLGVSLPMFSDGCADHAPSRMAPTWYCSSLPTFIHSFCYDSYNKNYSGFLYLPKSFRMGQRLQQEELSMCTTCVDYVNSLKEGESEGRFTTAERYMMAKCMPIPDHSNACVFQDDNHETYLKLIRPCIIHCWPCVHLSV